MPTTTPPLPDQIIAVLRATERTHRVDDVAAAFGMHRTAALCAAFAAVLDSLGRLIVRTHGAGATIRAA